MVTIDTKHDDEELLFQMIANLIVHLRLDAEEGKRIKVSAQ